jgi:hypothetical protein
VITNDTAQAELDAVIQATVARGPVLGRGGALPTVRSEAQAARMRALQAEGGWSLRALARKFGVSHRTAGRMLNRS